MGAGSPKISTKLRPYCIFLPITPRFALSRDERFSATFEDK